MPDQLQLRGGTTTEHATFTGASKEVTIDTTKKTAVVHDASTAGGNPLMREDGANSALVNGSATEPALAFAAGDADNGIYSPGTDQVAITTNGTERVEWGASEVVFNDGGNNYDFRIEGDTQANLLFVDASADAIGIGTSNPGVKCSIGGVSGTALQLKTADTNFSALNIGIAADHSFINSTASGSGTVHPLAFDINGTERARIDSSGRLLVGASSTRSNMFGGGSLTAPFLVETATTTNRAPAIINNANSNHGPVLVLGKTRGTAVGQNTVAADNDEIGILDFQVADGTNLVTAARIRSDVDGTPSSNSVSGELLFQTTNAGTNPATRMYISPAGNVGIGTTSPAAPLSVVGGTGDDPTIYLVGASNDNARIGSKQSLSIACNEDGTESGRTITFDNHTSELARIDSSGRLLVGTSSTTQPSRGFFQGRVSDSAGRITVARDASGSGVSAGTVYGEITFENNGGLIGGLISCQADLADNVVGELPGRLVFSTTADGASSPTERMRIQNDGIFNYFTEDHFTVHTSRTGTGPGILNVRNGATNVTDGTQVFVVRADGDCENTNGTYTSISDLKFKENVVDAGSQWQDLKAIRVRNFNFKEETNWSTHTQLGVVAQELEVVCPNLVKEVDNLDQEGTYKTVKTSVLYMKAVKALQEAMERIETLEAKVSALETN